MKARSTSRALMFSLFFAPASSFARAYHHHRKLAAVAAFSSSRARPENFKALSDAIKPVDETDSPWNDPNLAVRAEKKHALRARQHVNPLASKFQQPTALTPDWPRDIFDDMSRPLFLDIGCAKGGFLLAMAKHRPNDFNYLGLEIRPIVAHHAQQRVEKYGHVGYLGFVGCNVNVDLRRILTKADAKNKLEMVTIQFPDPHFKARHAKRRVVTPELVTSLAEFMPVGATVFLQSDIQSVLDDMREQFRNHPSCFRDDVESVDAYLEENILGVPTEREVSVLEKNLPVYRTVFIRTSEAL